MVIWWETPVSGSSIDPEPANVRSGVVYIINGITLTGTFGQGDPVPPGIISSFLPDLDS